jgi:UDP-N-acetylmuramoyl-L-alanyl-D-glutamate--2,6-diaminopimelate ligase
MTDIKAFLRKRLTRNQQLLGHKMRAMASYLRYGMPGQGMMIIGVTGTKGKTTSSHFVTSILEEAGFTVGMITTVSFKIGDKVIVNETNKTSLPPWKLYKLIKEMKEAHCNAIVIEVTSHSLAQYRVWGIPFRYVGFTNLSHDHLDYHKTMEEYRDAKLKLFQMKSVKAAAFNIDDPTGQYMLEKTTAPRRWSYSMETELKPVRATDQIYASHISANSSSASFTLHAEDEQARVQLQVPGRFNIENALCAAAICMNLNLKVGTIVAGLQNLEKVAGRLEKIESRRGFTVIVDYAHTPDSLEKLYSTLRGDVRGRMIAVLGATGDRDKTKRPIMGALAARFCDYVFVTDEDPYSEDPAEIIEEIAKGVPRGRTLFKPTRGQQKPSLPIIIKQGSESGEGVWWWKIVDRKQAIERAIALCKMDDVVLLTGMGSQTFRIVGTKQEPWNDREIVEDILREKNLL